MTRQRILMTCRPPDPPVRGDGRCAHCGGKRGRLPKAITQRNKAILARELDLDPFCSTECCRAWHGTELDRHPQKPPPADLEWSHT